MGKLVITLNTIKYLKPVQIYGRYLQKIKRKICKTKYTEYTMIPHWIPLSITELDADPDYISRFDVQSILEEKITLLHHIVNPEYGRNPDKDFTPLIRFNLHYFEYAIAMAAEYKRTNDRRYSEAFKKLYTRYIEERKGYSAYVASLHIPNILIALDLFGNAVDNDFRKTITKELYRQYQFLLGNQEIYLQGNHYFENLKAIIIGSVFYDETDICKKYVEKLKKEVTEEILPDGMHYELSAMYHKLILEDLLRVYVALGQTSIDRNWVVPIIQKMTDCALSLECVMHRTPLFNDAGDNVAKKSKPLSQAVARLIRYTPSLKKAFPNAGYYIRQEEAYALLIDSGQIGPPHMPGHGQCDCLSFEMSIKGIPVFVNSGTYQYQGDKRKYFRSTRAHNTVMIDGSEQSQCWGEHRVALRISDVASHQETEQFTGSYRNYRGELHSRRFVFEKYRIKVIDSFSVDKKRKIESYLHITPSCSVGLENEVLSIIKGNERVCVIKPIAADISIHDFGDLAVYAPEFGEIEKGTCILFSWESDSDEHGYIIEIAEGEKKND